MAEYPWPELVFLCGESCRDCIRLKFIIPVVCVVIIILLGILTQKLKTLKFKVQNANSGF